MVSGIDFPLVTGRKKTRRPARIDDDAKHTRGKSFQIVSRNRIIGATAPPQRAAIEHVAIHVVLRGETVDRT